MFEAEIHLQQHKPCVVSQLAAEFDTAIEIAIEELHDELVTFVIELDERLTGVLDRLTDSDQVHHAEGLGDGNFLVTKTSCGAYSAIERNHGILRRPNVVDANRRVYTVLFFRREDLRAMIEAFRKIGTVTLGKLAPFEDGGVRLTDRQHEVIEHALAAGYFEWPREVTSDELAAELDISRATLLEHLRKAESKLLTDALDSMTTEAEPSIRSESATPRK
ncbi:MULTISPECIES: helix-turn-helix domain-containing protein [Halococcus]|uniref:DNA binding protein n=1 Tax=Halococcus salifodinae DSM 8989 TaxID=1227456 RepID=M0N5X1_9EURY|nr:MULTISPECIES: helix-turn-helix domain-containing protein [Halococcus]EMA53332.1 DNA binding protein [Halococcus salifodinae DSM 8989]